MTGEDTSTNHRPVNVAGITIRKLNFSYAWSFDDTLVTF